MLAQVSGIPNPVPLVKGLTEQIWDKPLNYFAVGGMVLFGVGCVVLLYLILKWAAGQQAKVDQAQKTATAYEYLAKNLQEGVDRIEVIVTKIWERMIQGSNPKRPRE